MHPPRPCPSAAFEYWTPLLRERAHAFLVVLAVEALDHQLVERLKIARGLGAEKLGHGAFDRSHRERRVSGDRCRVLAREALDVRLRHDLVDEPHAKRL